MTLSSKTGMQKQVLNYRASITPLNIPVNTKRVGVVLDLDSNVANAFCFNFSKFKPVPVQTDPVFKLDSENDIAAELYSSIINLLMNVFTDQDWVLRKGQTYRQHSNFQFIHLTY